MDGRTRDLAAGDIMVISGVRVTTPLRTALDLGCHLHRRDALAALDQFMRHHGLGREHMTTEALRFFRRRGVVQLRQLIPLADPRAESPRESWTRLAIVDAGLPCPEPQHWIEVDGVPTFRLDLNMQFRSKQMLLRLNACVSNKLGLATKTDDYVIPEFEFEAFSDAAGNIGTFSVADLS